jgi:hypothetical protein
MFPRRKLIYYLLLNVFVSACVTLSILYVYDSQHRTSASRDDQPIVVDSSSAQFEITTIIGAGMADSEMLLIRNAGQSPADLMGWQISDEDGNVYTFNALSLPASAAIQLRTSAGKDSVIDLYWGLSAPVWHSGKTATLLDPAGNVRSVYQVP